MAGWPSTSFRRWLDRLRGKPVVWSDERYCPALNAIEARGSALASLPDDELTRLAGQLRKIDRNLRYFHTRFPRCKAWQLHADGDRDYVTPEGIRACHALEFLKSLV